MNRNKQWILYFLTFCLIVSLCACRGIPFADEGSQPSENISQESDTVETVDSEASDLSEGSVSSEDSDSEPDMPEEAYEQILDYFYIRISDPESDYEDRGGETGVMEAARTLGGDRAMESIGYTMIDISGDGISELLIGAISENTASSQIYALYTAENGIPMLVLEGWGRSSYLYMGGSDFLYQGSDGAMYTMFGICTMVPDGKQVSWRDFYFTCPKDESFSEIGFYHNTCGEMDPSVSEELELVNEAFRQIEEALMSQTQSVELRPFSDYTPSGKALPAAKPQVCVQWEADAELLTDYDAYEITEAPLSRIVFTTDGAVRHFTVLNLFLENVSESGSMEFSAHTALAVEALEPDRPLVIGLTFAGDLPSWGFQYEDPSGELRQFALEISGEDGSILVREADPYASGLVLNGPGSD